MAAELFRDTFSFAYAYNPGKPEISALTAGDAAPLTSMAMFFTAAHLFFVAELQP